MEQADIRVIRLSILIATFAVTSLLGYLFQKTNFCTMGALSDLFLMKNLTRLRQWILAIAISVIGFAVLAYWGLIDPLKSIYTSAKFLYLSTIVGSVFFGFGMVLASGCGAKTLVRIGSGSLKSFVVFIVMGLVAFMTMKGILGVLRVNSFDLLFVTLPTTQDLPHLLGFSSKLSKLILAVGLGVSLCLFVFKDAAFRTYTNILAGLGTGLAIIAMWMISGYWGYVAEDPNTLQELFIATHSGRMESLSFVAPYAYTLDWLLFYSDTSKVLTIGVVSVLGMIFGSWFQAMQAKTFRWQGFANLEDLSSHLIGASCMGFGGVLAMGCTIGQGLSGVSTLALSAFIALAGFVGGAYVGMKYLEWRTIQSPC
jgi:uncharacterized membrane protein YedE/YeeE